MTITPTPTMAVAHDAPVASKATEAQPRTFVTTDVFDTLLLRRPTSEPRRHTQIARLVVERLKRQLPGSKLDVETVRWARRTTQAWAYRAMRMDDNATEVQLLDILHRQIQLLGLPANTLGAFVDAELEVEQACLKPNRALIGKLNAARAQGARILAISDTALSKDMLSQLVTRVAGAGVVDEIYSSAEVGLTKRGDGRLFTEIVSRESLVPAHTLHHGDDRHADVDVPARLGFGVAHLPRPAHAVLRRRADGARHVVARGLSRNALQPGPRWRANPRTPEVSQQLFGKSVLGPIMVEFAVHLWLYLSSRDDKDGTVALFCARGGLLMRQVYEAVCTTLGLASPVRCENLMISRLAAARAPLLAGKQSAIDEIGREFRLETMQVLVDALASERIDLPAAHAGPASIETLERFMRSPDGATFVGRLERQAALFERRTQSVLGNASTGILVDTGLYGSTIRLMMDSGLDVRWEGALLARCNYKRFPTPHFPKVVGLWTERDAYNPADIRSSVLLYWKFIENMLEPDIASVTHFHEAGGEVVSNLETPGWRERCDGRDNPYMRGIMEHITSISGAGLTRQPQLTAAAWRTFNRVLRYPDRAEATVLATTDREKNFGRDSVVNQPKNEPRLKLAERLKLIKDAGWKQGAAVTLTPVSYRAVQFGLNGHYALRRFRRR